MLVMITPYHQEAEGIKTESTLFWLFNVVMAIFESANDSLTPWSAMSISKSQLHTFNDPVVLQE